MDGAQLCSWINTHVKFTETETIRQNAHVKRTNDKDYACAMAPRWTPAHKQLNLKAAKDRYSGLLSLVRMVRAIIPATKSQSIHLLALPCDFMRQLRATIVLLLNLANFITKQINFPSFEKLKSPYLISLHKSFTHRDTNFTRDFTVWTWTIAGETKQTIRQLYWKGIKA